MKLPAASCGVSQNTFEDFSETELNPVASYGEYSSSKWSVSIKRENSIAMSACINFRRPSPTMSTNAPFTSLNTAIAARPVW